MTELAEEEAARAEAEGADEDEPGAEPDPTEPDPEPAPEPVDMAKAVKQLDNENERHAKRVAEIMGEDAAQLHPCPTCVLGPVGFVFNLPDAQPEYKAATDTQTCDTCNGLGDVLSGSNNERSKLKACTACSGQGYVFKTEAPVVPIATPAAAPIDPAIVAQLRAAGYAVIDPPALPPAQAM